MVFETDDGWLESFEKCTQCKATLPLFDSTSKNQDQTQETTSVCDLDYPAARSQV